VSSAVSASATTPSVTPRSKGCPAPRLPAITSAAVLRTRRRQPPGARAPPPGRRAPTWPGARESLGQPRAAALPCPRENSCETAPRSPRRSGRGGGRKRGGAGGGAVTGAKILLERG
jgi:hypothetical protein